MFRISGFYDEAYSDLDKQLGLIKSLGGKYLCPRMVDGKNISAYTVDEFATKVKPRLDSAGVTFSSIGSPIGKVGIDDEDGYQGQLKKLAELVKIAQLMDCKFIRCFSFFVPKGADYGALRPKVVEKLKGFLKLVEGTDIVLLHENEKKIYGDTPERALELYHDLCHENFKLCYDASNYIQCKVDPWKAYEMTKDFTVYYHMKDCLDGVEVPLGTGQGRIKEILADLVARGYDGFLTLEPHTAKYALLKILFYVVPGLCFTKMARVFRRIDKTAGVRAFEKVTREKVFVWQYRNLANMLDEVGGEFV